MRVLILSPGLEGHFFQYLHHIADAVSELATTTIVAVPGEAVGGTWFEEYVRPLAPRLNLDPSLAAAGPGLASAVRQVLGLGRLIRRHRPDHVLLPTGDGTIDLLGLCSAAGVPIVPPATEIEGLLLRGRFAYMPSGLGGTIRAAVTCAARSRAPLVREHHLDPRVFELVVGRGGRGVSRCRVMPEPVEPVVAMEPAAARRMLGLPTDGVYLVAAGDLSRRKGTDLLLHAWAAAELPPDHRLLLAGLAKPEVIDLIHGPMRDLTASGRILLVDRVLTGAEFGALFQAADAVCAPHPAHIGSSGIVARAAAARRPLIASDFGWIGRTVSTFGLGTTCPVTDRDAFARALRRTLATTTAVDRRGTVADRFAAFHTAANFRRAWTARLRERLGLVAAPVEPSWEDVVTAATAGGGKPE